MPGSSSRTRRPSYTSTDRDMRAVTQLRRAGGPTKQLKTDVAQRSRAVASDRSGNTHTHTTLVSQPSISTASRRSRDAISEVLQQMSGGNSGQKQE